MKVEINAEDTVASVKVDGEEIADRIVGYSLSQDAMERPLLTLTFAPDEVDISAERVYLRKELDGNMAE